MIESIVTDAGFILAVRWVLAVIFLTALIHKIRAPAAFSGTLRAYRLLPESLTSTAAFLVIAAEVFTVVALLFNRVTGSYSAAALLLLYAFAIGLNILRGRRDIDCGCVGPALRQTLSGWLVIRNLAFAALALQTAVSLDEIRALTALDLFSAVAAALSFALVYSAANRLSVINARHRRQAY